MDKIKMWKYSIIRFFEWVKKSLQYSTQLKDDLDYDYVYILKVLKYKIERTKNEIELRSRDEYVDQMDQAIKMLSELIEDDFCKNEFERHDLKWGGCELKFTPCDDNKGFSTVTFLRQNAISEEDKEKEREELFEIMDLEEQRRKEAYTNTFLFIADNIRNWWY